MIRFSLACVWGLLFGLGLGLCGLPRADVIQGALDFSGDFNPTLYIAVVALACVYHVGYRIALRRGKPWFADALHLPQKRSIDRPLLLGSALFGAGWGLAGMCPGATLVALPGGDPRAVVFMLAVGVSIVAYNRRVARQSSSDGPAWSGASAAPSSRASSL